MMSVDQRVAKLNFDKDSNLGGVKLEPHDLAHDSTVMAEMADFFFRPMNLKSSNFPILPVENEPNLFPKYIRGHPLIT